MNLALFRKSHDMNNFSGLVFLKLILLIEAGNSMYILGRATFYTQVD